MLFPWLLLPVCSTLAHAHPGPQILASNPKLAQDPDSVMQLTDIMGSGGSRAELLLQAALAAFAGGNVQQAEGIALQLARKRHAAAWELAAAVAANQQCSSAASRQQLLSFALLHAPQEQLLALLAAWEAADEASGGQACWLHPSGDPSGPASAQELLGRELAQFLGDGSSTRPPSGSNPDMLVPVSCLLALGPQGLQQWDALLGEQQQLPYQQQRQALLVGLTAALLLALQPGRIDVSSAAAVGENVNAAQQLLALPPAELASRWQERAGATAATTPVSRKASAAPLSSRSSRDHSATPSEAASDAGDDNTPGCSGPRQYQQHGAAVEEGPAAAAAAASDAVERYLSCLISSADAQRVAQLLPGVDATAALAASSSDPGSRRQVVLQLAQAAARPGSLGTGDTVQLLLSPKAQGQAADASPKGSFRRGGGNSRSKATPPGRAAEAGSQQKKTEEFGSTVANGGTAWNGQVDEERATSMLQDALQLAHRYSVPAWEVRLAFVESLLQHHKAQPDQQSVRALLQQSWLPLLEAQQSAAAALAMLLQAAWPASSSRAGAHQLLCLQLMVECCASLATLDASQGAEWEQAATILSGCRAAVEALLQAGPGLDAKAFTQQLVLATGHWAASHLPTSPEPAWLANQAHTPGADELAQELLPHVMAGNVRQLAGAVGLLQERQAAAADLQGSGVPSAFPLTPSSVCGVLACKLLAEGEAIVRFC